MNGDQPAARRRIVAGVDGSEPSKAALAWAVREARLTGAVVEAVIVWRLPLTYGLHPMWHVNYPGAAARVLGRVIAEVGHPSGVRPRVVLGRAAKVLAAASAGADLLVVGSHRHGWLGQALPGSVSQYCLRNAHCPVLVIRSNRAAACGHGRQAQQRSSRNGQACAPGLPTLHRRAAAGAADRGRQTRRGTRSRWNGGPNGPAA